jgi:hypothetical protein
VTLSDETLRDLFLRLDLAAQRALARHILLDKPTPASWAALRRLKSRLKRQAREAAAQAVATTCNQKRGHTS